MPGDSEHPINGTTSDGLAVTGKLPSVSRTSLTWPCIKYYAAKFFASTGL